MQNYRMFLSGAICMLSWTAALFFLKFWKKSGDTLFLFFSAAFALLGIERIVSLVGKQPEFEGYVIRLCAFVLILVAIGQKNRTNKL